MRQSTDVLVGAGPVGLMMAGELQRRGVDHLIIEQKSEPARLTKALGVSPRTLELFDRRPEPSRPDPRSDDGVIGQRAASRRSVSAKRPA